MLFRSLPRFLGPDNIFLLPVVETEDYATNLWSVFGQYSHRFGSIDAWAGLRYDIHDDYENHLSYNTGASVSPSEDWVLKLILGNAYRTPFSKQLHENEDPDLERITTVNLETAWTPGSRFSARVCGFYNRVDNHILEDTYAGLSQPNHQEIYGVELEGRLSPHESLDIGANLTLMENAGPEEPFSYVKIQFPDPDTYIDLNYPYDIGAKTLFNLTGTWRPNERFTLHARVGYVSERDLVYLDETDPDHPAFRTVTAPDFWTLDLNGTIHDLFCPGLDLELAVENAANHHYDTPGTYGFMEGPPATARITLRKLW